MKLPKRLLTGLLVIAAALTAAAQKEMPAPAQTLLYVNSQPGDPVGQGKQQTFTPADGTFTLRAFDTGLSVGFHPPDFSQSWNLNFGPATGVKFTNGEYEGAQRFATPTRPRLDVNGYSGCNTTAGRFLLSELVVAPDGTVERLAVDFEQHCDGAPPALYGSMRYNSRISLVPRISVGNATVLKGNTGSNDGLLTIALSMPGDAPVSVQYSTQDGSGAQGTDYSATTGTVTFEPQITSQTIAVPVLGDRLPRGNKTFHVKLSQPNGAPLGDPLATARILDPNVSLTALSLYGQPGDFIHPGPLLITRRDGTFGAFRNFFQGVTLDINNVVGGFWELDFAAPDSAPLVPGDYENAREFPDPGTPWLNVSGSGASCNTLTGRFTVLKAKYDPAGNVKHFAADFEQHCEDAPPALFGSIRYRSKLRQISVSNAEIANGSATFTLTLNPVSDQSASVAFATADGTAVAGIDYSPVSQTLGFAPGETSHTISVQLLGNPTGKKFYGQLSSPSGAPLWIDHSSATIP
jgi:hypothetical protein